MQKERMGDWLQARNGNEWEGGGQGDSGCWIDRVMLPVVMLCDALCRRQHLR